LTSSFLLLPVCMSLITKLIILKKSFEIYNYKKESVLEVPFYSIVNFGSCNIYVCVFKHI